MKRISHTSNSFKEAQEWEIQQQIKMTPDQRFAAAKELRIRACGKNVPNLKDCYEKNKKNRFSPHVISFLSLLYKYKVE